MSTNYSSNNNSATTTAISSQALRTVIQPRKRQPKLELSDEQKAEIREAFEIFDMDKDGALDFHEFKVWSHKP